MGKIALYFYLSLYQSFISICFCIYHRIIRIGRVVPEDGGRSEDFGAAREGHLELALPAASLGVAQGEQELQETR